MMENDLFLREIALPTLLPENEYPGCLSVVRNLYAMGKLTFHSPVAFFVGENGVGKSTLIEAIAVSMGFNPEGGTANFSFSTCNSHSGLHKHLTAVRSLRRRRDGFFLRAESFYNVASYVDKLDRETRLGPSLLPSYGGVSLHEQSHGESFLALVENRFGGNGLYILDEPEAALSPRGLMRLAFLMHDLVEKNSQFIISTHSPILMSYPGAEVYELTASSITSVPYWETEHFQLTKRFLNDPERMFTYLFEE